MENYGKKNFVDALAENEQITKVDAALAYEAVFGLLKNLLEDGSEVAIPGIGKFKTAERAARTARNPQTDEKIEIPAHKVCKFVPAKSLKEAVYGL